MEGTGSEVTIGGCAIETDRCVSSKFKPTVTERKWEESCNEGEGERGCIAGQIKRNKTFAVNYRSDCMSCTCVVLQRCSGHEHSVLVSVRGHTLGHHCSHAVQQLAASVLQSAGSNGRGLRGTLGGIG